MNALAPAETEGQAAGESVAVGSEPQFPEMETNGEKEVGQRSMGKKTTSEYLEVESKPEADKETEVESGRGMENLVLGGTFGGGLGVDPILLLVNEKEMENAESKPMNGILESGVDRKSYVQESESSPGEGVMESIENSLPDNSMPL